MKKMDVGAIDRKAAKRRIWVFFLSPSRSSPQCTDADTCVEIKCWCKWRLALRRGINSCRMSGILLLVTFSCASNPAVPRVWQPLPYEDLAFPCKGTSAGAYLMSAPIAQFLNALRLELLITTCGARRTNTPIPGSAYLHRLRQSLFNCSLPTILYGYILSASPIN